jgi:hypothetical protein
VPWAEFRTAFRDHHMSAGTMRRKLAEFLELHQGNRTIFDYTQEFNNLAQYGGHHVDTDQMKGAHYLATGSPYPLLEPVIQLASECRH